MLHLYDGNNHVRRRLANPGMTHPIRDLFTEAYSTPGTQVYVWDGFKSLDARRAIYPAYKTNRGETAEDIYANMKLLKELLLHSKAIQIEVQGYEADDIIAHLARRYKGRQPIHIHSNDADFAQLGLPMDRETFHVEPRYVRLHKTLVGDPRDTIPGVKGFGQKAWEACNKGAMLEWAETEFSEEGLFDSDLVGWSKASTNWLWKTDPDGSYPNIQQLRVFWKIIGFIRIDDKKMVDNHMVVGTPDHHAAFERMKEFMI